MLYAAPPIASVWPCHDDAMRLVRADLAFDFLECDFCVWLEVGLVEIKQDVGRKSYDERDPEADGGTEVVVEVGVV